MSMTCNLHSIILNLIQDRDDIHLDAHKVRRSAGKLDGPRGLNPQREIARVFTANGTTTNRLQNKLESTWYSKSDTMRKVKKFKSPKLLSLKDNRVKDGQMAEKKVKKINKKEKAKRRNEQSNVKLPASTLFFNYNQSLGPPYQIICDTNFINFSIKNKLDVKQALMDCLLAKTTPYVTECIIAELEKLGAKYRVALQIVKNNFEVLPCSHKGTYADDCIIDRISRHRCYMVGTCDKELKGRIRKVPGIPIVYIKRRQYAVEKMPELE